MNGAQEELRSLIERAQRGDEEALCVACAGNEALVHAVARRYMNRGVEYEDLVQLGMIGLIKAIRGFNLSLEYRFSTYAVPLIMGEMRRTLRDDGPVHVARSLKESAARLMRARDELARGGQEPSMDAVAAACGMSAADAVLALGAQRAVRSLDEPVAEDDERAAASFLCDLRAEIPGSDRTDVRDAVRRLPERERLIVALRFFRGLTQAETAAHLGISQVQVSRLEKGILEELRERLA